MKNPENPGYSEGPVDEFESAIFAAELGDAPEIDLHGLTTSEAMSQLDHFINHEAVAGSEAIKIIHGRGSGKLRAEIHKWLKTQKELVGKFRDSHAPGQMGGVTIVALHRLHK